MRFTYPPYETSLRSASPANSLRGNRKPGKVFPNRIQRKSQMQWQDIRQHYPQQWLLLEALKAHSEGDRRILDELAILGAFPDSVQAMKDYSQLHHQSPERELYVFHTSREKLDIVERR
jgi:hypothetical protein